MSTCYTDRIIIRFIPITPETTALNYNFDIDKKYAGEWEANCGITLGPFSDSLSRQVLKQVSMFNIQFLGGNDYMLWGKSDTYYVTVGVRNIDTGIYYNWRR